MCCFGLNVHALYYLFEFKSEQKTTLNFFMIHVTIQRKAQEEEELKHKCRH